MNMHFVKHFTFVVATKLAVFLSLAAISNIAAQTPPVTLTTPTTSEKAPTVDGFIQRWLVLEPIAASGLTDSAVQAAVKKEYFPNQSTVIPRDGDKVIIGGAELTWHAVETLNYNVNLFHFARAQGKKTSNVLFWAVTIINCPEEIPEARLAIGSNDASIWWVNGQEVVGIYGDRPAIIDDGVSKRLSLKKGINVIRGAVHNRAGQTDFLARFLDKDDLPITNIVVDLREAAK